MLKLVFKKYLSHSQSLPWVMVLTDKIGNLAAQVGSQMLNPYMAEALKRGHLLSDNHWV